MTSKVAPAELRAHALDIATHPDLGLTDDQVAWLRREVYAFAMYTKRHTRTEILRRRSERKARYDTL
jgi:hypothetical protein